MLACSTRKAAGEKRSSVTGCAGRKAEYGLITASCSVKIV